MPRSRITCTALGCSALGWLPALTALTVPRDSRRHSASAICERALLPVHRNSTRPRDSRSCDGPAAEGGARGPRSQQFAAAREIEYVVGVAPVGAATRWTAAVAQQAQVVRDEALAPVRQSAQLAHTAIAAQARSRAAIATDAPPGAQTAAVRSRRVPRRWTPQENTSTQFDVFPELAFAKRRTKAPPGVRPRSPGFQPQGATGANRGATREPAARRHTLGTSSPHGGRLEFQKAAGLARTSAGRCDRSGQHQGLRDREGGEGRRSRPGWRWRWTRRRPGCAPPEEPRLAGGPWGELRRKRSSNLLGDPFYAITITISGSVAALAGDEPRSRSRRCATSWTGWWPKRSSSSAATESRSSAPRRRRSTPRGSS